MNITHQEVPFLKYIAYFMYIIYGVTNMDKQLDKTFKTYCIVYFV